MPGEPPPDDPAAPDVVRRAIERLGIDVAEVAGVPDSHSSVVRRLTLRDGARVVLKVPFNATKARREAAALRSLAHLSFVPRVLAESDLGDGAAGVLMSHLPGGPFPAAAQCTEALAASAGRALAQIHECTLARAAGAPPDPPWPDVLRGRLAEYLPRCCDGVPDAPWSRVEAALERGLRELPPSEPRAVHLDFRTGNLLREGDDVVGVVDFESSRNGAPHLDFLKVAHELWDERPALRDALLGAYATIRPVPPDLDRLRPFHELYSSVACVAWSALRRQTDSAFCREHVARALRALETLTSRAV